jgi:hypothetical protein
MTEEVRTHENETKDAREKTRKDFREARRPAAAGEENGGGKCP